MQPNMEQKWNKRLEDEGNASIIMYFAGGADQHRQPITPKWHTKVMNRHMVQPHLKETLQVRDDQQARVGSRPIGNQVVEGNNNNNNNSNKSSCKQPNSHSRRNLSVDAG